MAIAYQSKKKEGLGPLSSGGAIGGTAGGTFSGKATGTGFTNAQDLLAANQGKGSAMLDSLPGLSSEDESAAVSGLSELKGFNPQGALKTTNGWTKPEMDVVTFADGSRSGNTYQAPTSKTEYTGLSTADVDSKADKLRGLKGKFDDLSGIYGSGEEGVARRNEALSGVMQKTNPLYSGLKGQGAMDSFLMESEGAPKIQASADRLKGLIGKFDGFDGAIGKLKGDISDAQSKVGETTGEKKLMKTEDLGRIDPMEKALSRSTTPPIATSNPVVDAIRNKQNPVLGPMVNMVPNDEPAPSQGSGGGGSSLAKRRYELEQILGAL